MIIDVHAHLGWDCVFDEDFTLEELLFKHKELNIDKSILQPGTCHDIETVIEQHDAISNACKQYPGQFYGMANPNPHLKENIYIDEIRRCIEKLGFVGIKLHPFAHAANPGSKDAQKVYKIAEEFDVPVMIHTGAGIPFSNPVNLINVAKLYPNVKFIMAHCGMMVLANEVLGVLQQCSNVYADITWTAGFNIRHWSESVGTHRFMYGSDHADNAGTELAKVRTSGLTTEQQEWILHKTASSLFEDTIKVPSM